MTHRTQLESMLAQAAQELGDPELSVLTKIATRLVRGQQEYGPLYAGKRVWSKEAQEEAFDLAVYIGVKLEGL